METWEVAIDDTNGCDVVDEGFVSFVPGGGGEEVFDFGEMFVSVSGGEGFGFKDPGGGDEEFLLDKVEFGGVGFFV